MISNATKAVSKAENGNIIIEVSAQDTLQIKVIDNGPGFGNLNLFEKGASKFRSSGLGLHFCKQVVEDHGGSIEATCMADKTVFKFSI